MRASDASKKSRPARGASDGGVGVLLLACGHLDGADKLIQRLLGQRPKHGVVKGLAFPCNLGGEVEPDLRRDVLADNCAFEASRSIECEGAVSHPFEIYAIAVDVEIRLGDEVDGQGAAVDADADFVDLDAARLELAEGFMLVSGSETVGRLHVLVADTTVRDDAALDAVRHEDFAGEGTVHNAVSW